MIQLHSDFCFFYTEENPEQKESPMKSSNIDITQDSKQNSHTIKWLENSHVLAVPSQANSPQLFLWHELGMT